MRKLLLASAATLGALLATSGAAMAQPVKPVAPGTIVVHLNGYMQFEIGGFGSTFNQVNTATGPYKLNPITTIGDFRIYPGFDAQTVGGVEYGAQAEIRTNYSGAGVGQNGKVSPTLTSTSTSTTRGTAVTTTTTTTETNASNDSLYVKRAYGYLGTPTAGFVRLGQTDSAFTLSQTGVVEAFGDGGQWTLEGGEAALLPTNAAPTSTVIYADQAALYSTDKIVYISPAVAGFNIIAGYEPNSNGLKEGYLSNSGASSTSAALSSSPIAADIGSRRKNTVDAALAYLLKSNGFLVKANAAYLYGSPIDYTGPAVTTATALRYGYDNLGVYQAGAQVTYAGFTLGANVKGGQVENGYVFKPRGTRDAFTYIVGGNYVVGPYVIGASYFNAQTAGTYLPGAKEAKTLSEYGAVVGANYVVGKDLSLFTQYMYGHRHQPGNAVLSNGNAQVQVIAAGATLKW